MNFQVKTQANIFLLSCHPVSDDCEAFYYDSSVCHHGKSGGLLEAMQGSSSSRLVFVEGSGREGSGQEGSGQEGSGQEGSGQEDSGEEGSGFGDDEV